MKCRKRMISVQKFSNALCKLSTRQIKTKVMPDIGSHLNVCSSSEQFHIKSIYVKVK